MPASAGHFLRVPEGALPDSCYCTYTLSPESDCGKLKLRATRLRQSGSPNAEPENRGVLATTRVPASMGHGIPGGCCAGKVSALLSGHRVRYVHTYLSSHPLARPSLRALACPRGPLPRARIWTFTREHRRRPNALAFSIFKSISAIARATLLPWRSSRQLRFGLCKKEDVSKSFFEACRGGSPSQRCSRRVPRCRVGTVCVARRVTRTYAPYSRAPRALALRAEKREL